MKKNERGGRRAGAGRPALYKKNVHLKLSYEAANKLSVTALKDNKTMSDVAEELIHDAIPDDILELDNSFDG